MRITNHCVRFGAILRFGGDTCLWLARQSLGVGNCQGSLETVQEAARQCELFIEPCWRGVDNDMLLTVVLTSVASLFEKTAPSLVGPGCTSLVLWSDDPAPLPVPLFMMLKFC